MMEAAAGRPSIHPASGKHISLLSRAVLFWAASWHTLSDWLMGYKAKNVEYAGHT